MFDRILMPALTFGVMIASLGAFAADIALNRTEPVLQLERVVVTGHRELPATPVAQAEAAPATARSAQ